MGEGYVTTHVLDAGRGCPAAGMRIELFRIEGEARRLVRAVDDQRGRADGCAGDPEGGARAGGLRAAVPCRGLPRRGRGARGEPAVPRPDPDPVRHRRPGRALPRAAAAGALQLLDLPGELRAC